MVSNLLSAIHSVANILTFNPWGNLFLALIAGALAATGAIAIGLDDFPRIRIKKSYVTKKRIEILFASIASVFIVGAFIFLITRSLKMSAPIALLGVGVPLRFIRNRESKKNDRIRQSWPEVIDLLISGLQSGLSLSETLITLETRGPEILHPLFGEITRRLQHGEPFESVLRSAKNMISKPEADQIFETLILAKSVGGRDINVILRTLAEFIRQDVLLRNEIDAKHGWIRNSASLAAISPWLLLLLLATQPATIAAFSSPSGFLILATGVGLTGVAYLWMDRVGKLPQPPRALA